MNNYRIKISKNYLNSHFCFNSNINFRLNFNLNFKIIILLFTFIITDIFTIELKSQVIINEICPINYKSLLDDDHSNEDWIELYNTADTAVSLKGYRIFDKNEYENAWVFPDTIMPPKSFLTIFASGKNRTQDDKFVMETSGEGMYYWVNPEGYSYAYTEVEGDFEAKVQITSFQNADFFANAGIMVREALDNKSRFVAFVAREPNVDHNFYCKYRNQNNKRIDRINFYYSQELLFPELYLKMVRKGDWFFMSIIDVSGFQLKTDSLKIALPQNLYIGLTGNSKNVKQVANIYFKDFIINNILQDLTSFNFIEFNTGHKGKFYKNNTLHTSFKLKNEGEDLFFWDNNQNLISNVSFPKLDYDISFNYNNSFNDSAYVQKFGFSTVSPNKLNNELYLGFAPEPALIFENEIFENEVKIKINNIDENTKTYFTINSDNPTENNFKYDGSTLEFYENTILRVVNYKTGYLPSKIITKSFLKNINSKLDFISLTIDNKSLFDPKEGIYTNPLKDKEVIGNIEFFKFNKNIFSQQVGVKIHGGVSRTFNQKSFRFYARDIFGTDSINSDILDFKNENVLERLILRNGGQDYYSTKLRDVLANKLSLNLKKYDVLQYKPISLFLNKEYWGLYFTKERFDDNYIRNKYNLKNEEFTILHDSGAVKHGTSSIYTDTYNFFINNDNINNINLDEINKKIDVDNFVSYVFLNTFLMNRDWVIQNILFWYRNEDKKLIFVNNDLDATIGLWGSLNNHVFHDLNANKIHLHKIFFKLMENEYFKDYYITSVYDYFNTSFKSEKMIEMFDKMVDEVKDDIPAHQARFPESVPNWHQAVDSIRFFLQERPSYYKLHLSEFFQIHYEFRKVNVKLDTGSINFNTIRLNEDFEGEYLLNQKLTLKINLPFGLKLRHWLVNGEVYSNSEYIEIVLTDDVVIIPVLFDEANDKLPNIVINEIMHKSPDDNDSKDWIEFYNNEDVDVDLSNWQIYDDKETEEFTFPLEVKIKSKDYLVVTRNLVDFNAIYDKIGSVVNNKVGDLNFGLSANDQVRLFDNFKNLIDSVDYNITSPWPTNTFGEGWSLELISPELDNTQGENWQASYDFMGTPGRKNSIANSVDRDTKSNTNDFTNILYPNPNNGEFTIDLTRLSSQSINQIKIYDLNNRLVYENVISETNNSTQNIKLQNLTQGVYTLQLLSDGYTKVITKFIIE